MQNRYESQPFQVVRQINNFSPLIRSNMGLKERTDFNNISSNFVRSNDKNIPQKTERPKFTEQDICLENIRPSMTNAPMKKIWESDWTLLIPESHKENGNMF